MLEPIARHAFTSSPRRMASAYPALARPRLSLLCYCVGALKSGSSIHAAVFQRHNTLSSVVLGQSLQQSRQDARGTQAPSLRDGACSRYIIA